MNFGYIIYIYIKSPHKDTHIKPSMKNKQKGCPLGKMWRDLPQDKKPKFFQIASHEGPEPAKTWWTEEKAKIAGEKEAEQAEEEEPFPKIHGCLSSNRNLIQNGRV